MEKGRARIEPPDLSEKGGLKDGQPQRSDDRLFMQLLAFGGCTDPGPVAEHIARTGVDGVVYEDVNDPRGIAVLTLVWGFNWPILKIGVTEIAPLTFRAITLPFAALGLLAVSYLSGDGIRIPRAWWPRVAMLALLNIVVADGGIVCWDCKYHFRLWRPVTAIREADRDGNPDTHRDARWE